MFKMFHGLMNNPVYLNFIPILSQFESQWAQEFSLLQIVQTGSEVHPTSYPMGTGGSFPGGKAAGA
jgi:hypothetical protein